MSPPAAAEDDLWRVRRTKLQRKLEEADRKLRSRAASLTARTVIVLAVVTLALGLAVLALAVQLNVNDTVEPPPRLALSHDGEERDVQIIHAEPGLRWSDLQLEGDCMVLLNGRPLSESPQAPVTAGDVLSCEDGATLQILSTRERGGALLHDSNFG